VEVAEDTYLLRHGHVDPMARRIIIIYTTAFINCQQNVPDIEHLWKRFFNGNVDNATVATGSALRIASEHDTESTLRQ
jgi:hypothetical protein